MSDRFIYPRWYTQQELDNIRIEQAEGDLGAMEIDDDIARMQADGPDA